MQDPQSGKMITKGPKVGRLFLFYFSQARCSFPPFVSSESAIFNFQIWHKRLGHPNSYVLHDLLKSGVLGNKIFPSLSVVQFDCNSSKLGESKILPFSIHKSKVNQPFNMIHSDL